MDKPIYSVQMVEGMGRGIIAEKDIKRGEVITNCELLVLSPEDTIKVNETDLKWYTFTFNAETNQDCLVMGDGEIFNHDDDANVLYGLIEFNGRKLMRFQACRDIKRGEQLFIDYGADVKKVDIEGYTINLI
jgi:SET domain-containing protein